MLPPVVALVIVLRSKCHCGRYGAARSPALHGSPRPFYEVRCARVSDVVRWVTAPSWGTGDVQSSLLRVGKPETLQCPRGVGPLSV